MNSVLSTKILTPEQKKPLLNNGFGLVEHDFISVESIDFKMPENVENGIFTSQNAVKTIQNSALRQAQDDRIQNCYCVGEKTKKLLEENGINVIAFADYGKDLAKIIVEKYADRKFIFFCGNRRRDEMPSILKKNKVSFEEIEVYKTFLTPKKFEQTFDGILFFSPSGVESFCKENELKNSTAFCIGTTTASEAKKHTDKIVVSKKPTIESLVRQTIATQNFASS